MRGQDCLSEENQNLSFVLLEKRLGAGYHLLFDCGSRAWVSCVEFSLGCQLAN